MSNIFRHNSINSYFNKTQNTSLTLAILSSIFSCLALIWLINITIDTAYMPVLVQCGVEDFKFEPINNIPSFDKIAKCRFINLNPAIYGSSSNVYKYNTNYIYNNHIRGSTCTFDTYKQYIYVHVPTTYWSKTPSTVTTEIFKLPCQYNTKSYCPSQHIPNPSTHTSQLTVYPTGYHNISDIFPIYTNILTDNPKGTEINTLNSINAKTYDNMLNISCYEHSQWLWWGVITLVIIFTISLCILLTINYSINTYQTLDDIICDYYSSDNTRVISSCNNSNNNSNKINEKINEKNNEPNYEPNNKPNYWTYNDDTMIIYGDGDLGFIDKPLHLKE